MVAPIVGVAASALGSGALTAGGAAAGGGFLAGLGSFFGSQGGQALLGGLGGMLGGALGRGKRTGYGKAFNRSQFFLDAHTRLARERADKYGADLFQSLTNLNPLFGAMQSRALGDLNDEARTSRLTEAFQANLSQQQAARGTFRSPTAALQNSFAGLQFMEQQRQQSLSNALSVFGASQPLLTSTLTAMGLSSAPMADIGFQQLASNMQQQQSRTQSILNMAGEGFALGQGWQADRRQQPFRDALYRAFAAGDGMNGSTYNISFG